MTKLFYHTLGVVVLMLALASCSSTKSLKKADFIDGMSEVEYVEHVIANTGGWEALTAKMSLALDLEGKGSVTKVNGTLRIKKGEVIQMSIVPFLGIEVARVEIAPDGILVIDRMNKRYVQVPFAEVQALAHADLDFSTLQALFLNELFLPGKKVLASNDASAFDVQKMGAESIQLDVKKGRNFTYQFLTSASLGLLKESCIGLKNTPYLLRWKYDDFRPLEQKSFPADMQVSFEGGSKPVKAAFALSRLSVNADWETHTEVSSKYEKVPLEDILKLLMKR